MWKSLKKYWFIFWKFRAIRFMMLLEYRGNFWFWAFVSLMWTVFNFFFFDLIIGARNELAGWNKTEMYVLISTFTMLDAFTWSFFYHNMRDYIASIFNGQLTITLTRPINSQFLLSVQNNSYTNVVRFFVGLGILIVTLRNGQIPLTLAGVIGFALFFFISLLFVYTLWFIVATCSFWVDRLDNINELVPSTRRVWQVPKEVFTGFASTFFSVLLPLSLIASLRSEILLGRASFQWLAYYAVFTAVLFWLAHLFFTFSIRKYSGVAN